MTWFGVSSAPRGRESARPRGASPGFLLSFSGHRAKCQVMPGIDLRDELRRELRRHPRVVYQKLFEGGEQLERLAASLPTFAPFRGGAGYASVLWVMDWD